MVGIKGGMFVRQHLEFIEHGGDIPRHADLIALGMIGLSQGFL